MENCVGPHGSDLGNLALAGDLVVDVSQRRADLVHAGVLYVDDGFSKFSVFLAPIEVKQRLALRIASCKSQCLGSGHFHWAYGDYREKQVVDR